MSKWIELMRVDLGPNHKPTGNTKHYLGLPRGGRQEFPPFVSLSIGRYQGDAGFYLLYHPERGLGTDTWHVNLSDAIHQAEYEFGVTESEWTRSPDLQ
jgi:hypothetical protein